MTVYYDPSEPSEAYLYEGAAPTPVVPVGFGTVFVLLGTTAILWQRFGPED